MSQDEPGVVLHVDDEADTREALAAVLTMSGFQPHSASSPRDALDAAAKLRDELDVLIVDYHLDAELSGTEVAEAIARTLGRSLPTIILTGDPANAQIPLLSNAPVWLIRKPAHPEMLMAALPSLVQFNRVVRGFEEDERHLRNWVRSGQ